MAKGIYIDINERGLKEFFKTLKNELSERTALIDQELAAHGELMATSAKMIAPVDTGRLRNSISLKKENFLSYQLVAQTDYAAYIEFGTGKYAANYVPSLDEEWQKIAIQFKKGPGSNIPAVGYMNKSVEAYTPSLIKSIQQIVDKDERL